MTDNVNTHAPLGDPGNVVAYSNRLLQANLVRTGIWNKLTGEMTADQLKKAEDGETATTSASYPVVRAMNLKQGSGDEIKIKMFQPVGAYPVMGGEYARGRETPLSSVGDRLRVNQARFPVNAGDTMTAIRDIADYRSAARPVAQRLIDGYMEQTNLIHAAGARGFHNNISWVVPTDSHPDFEKTMVSRVRAPTKNRHFLADADGLRRFAANAGEVDVATTDLLSIDVLDAIRAAVQELDIPPNPVVFRGDPLASDSPFRLLLVSPAQYNAFSKDPAFRQWVAAAHNRAAALKNHPLFMGENSGLWNGIFVKALDRPIRFYAGDPVKYCAAADSEAESKATVPEAFGKDFAIDRAILLGGSAVAEAFGAVNYNKGGKAVTQPVFWREEADDYDDKSGILVGTIRGVSKLRFLTETGKGKEYIDHGVMAIDTAVRLVA